MSTKEPSDELTALWARQLLTSVIGIAGILIGVTGASVIGIAGILIGVTSAYVYTLYQDDPEQASKNIEAALSDRLTERGISIDKIEPSRIDGLYAVEADGDVIYVTQDAKYMLLGPLYDIKNDINHTEIRQRVQRIDRLRATVSEDEMIRLAAKDAPDDTPRLYVMHDPTCPFCQRYGQSILEAVESGKLVANYLMYPRRGPNSAAGIQLERIWCAKDRQRALVADLMGQKIDAEQRDNCSAPVAEQWELAKELGATATPFSILPNGETYSGIRSLDPVIAGEFEPQSVQ